MTNITILGAGAMASAISVPLAKNSHEVRMWGTEFDKAIIDVLKADQPHPTLNVLIKGNFFYDNELETALKDSEVVVFAVISSGLRSIAQKAKPFLANQIVINVAKGFDNSQTMIEVLEQELPGLQKVTVAGPSIAAEVAQEQITHVVFASKEKNTAKLCKKIFQTKNYRVEILNDAIGAEICSALKNVYAIAINVGRNNNHKSALFTQSLTEMTKFAKTFGGKSKTVYGLAGLGDLHVTSQGGRNGMLGQLIASGKKPSEALAELKEKNTTVEGHAATKAAYELAKAKGLKLPLLEATYGMLYEDKEFEL
ncbi:glycerol-3-phosphate dehydrogenase [Candidatus Woesearchaeota archaeon]|nr:glycerol-3-phosphate dehydrogenase [Candidatus Woesearchaeota archaeon]